MTSWSTWSPDTMQTSPQQRPTWRRALYLLMDQPEQSGANIWMLTSRTGKKTYCWLKCKHSKMAMTAFKYNNPNWVLYVSVEDNLLIFKEFSPILNMYKVIPQHRNQIYLETLTRLLKHLILVGVFFSQSCTCTINYSKSSRYWSGKVTLLPPITLCQVFISPKKQHESLTSREVEVCESWVEAKSKTLKIISYTM